jgi:hypothetical protein
MLVGGWGLFRIAVWYEMGLRAGAAVLRTCGPVVVRAGRGELPG